MQMPLLSPASAVRLAWARTTLFSAKPEKFGEKLEYLSLKKDWEKLWTFTAPTLGEINKTKTEDKTEKPGLAIKEFIEATKNEKAPADLEVLKQIAGKVAEPGPLGRISQTVTKDTGVDLTATAILPGLATSPDEFRYVLNALAAVDGCVRSLETIYKIRDLNFTQREKLMAANMEYVALAQGRGKTLHDDLRSFIMAAPGLILGGVAGTSLAILANVDLVRAGLVIIASILSIYGLSVGWSWVSTQWKLQNYIRVDYERGLYFEGYLSQVRERLEKLYEEVDSLHLSVFGVRHQGDSARQAVNSVLSGLEGDGCQYIHEHMNLGLITTRIWSKCDASENSDQHLCPHWSAENKGSRNLSFRFHTWFSKYRVKWLRRWLGS